MNTLVQRLTTKQKIKEFGSIKNWCKKVVETFAMIHFSNMNNFNNTLEMLKNYELYYGKIDADEYGSLDLPYLNDKQQNDIKPIEDLKHYDISSIKIDLLAGEESKRPFNWTVFCTDYNTITEALEKKKELIVQYLQYKVQKDLQDRNVIPKAQYPNATPIEVQAKEEESKPKDLKEIDRYMRYDYKSNKEIVLNKILKKVILDTRAKDVFIDSFKDLLITGQEVNFTGCINGEPSFRRVHPLYFDYDRTTETKFIHDAAWAKEIRYISLSQVYDEFYDDFTEKDRILMDKYANMAQVGIAATGQGYFGFTSLAGHLRPFIDNTSGREILVVRYEWKSLKKVGFVYRIDEEGKLYKDIVDENYKKQKGEKVDWTWINEVWETTVVAGEIIVRYRPLPYQHRKLENISYCKLSYTGYFMKYSLMSRMRELQVLHNIIMHRIKLVIARAGGKSFIMDIAQLPRIKGWDVNKWLYYLNSFGVAFINSMQEGTTKTTANKYPTFNQFSQLDLGISSAFVSYIQTLDRIQLMMVDITGITPQRAGQSESSETLGGIEHAITQSNNITEMYFNYHNQVKYHTLCSLLEVAKIAFASKKKSQYLLDDGAREIISMDLEENIMDIEYDLVISDSAKDKEILDIIKRMLPQLMGAGQIPFLDLMKVLASNSIAEATQIVETAQAKAEEAAKNNQQQQLQHEQQLQQMQAELAKTDRDFQELLKRMELENKDTINVRDNATKLEMAHINSESNLGVANIYDKTDHHGNLISSYSEDKKLEIESERNDIQREQQANDMRLKKMDVDMKALEITKARIDLEASKHKAAQAEQKAKQDKTKPKNK